MKSWVKKCWVKSEAGVRQGVGIRCGVRQTKAEAGAYQAKSGAGVRQIEKGQPKNGWLKNKRAKKGCLKISCPKTSCLKTTRAKILALAFSIMCAAGLVAGVTQVALAADVSDDSTDVDPNVTLTIEVTYDQTGARSMLSNVNDLRANEAWITLEGDTRYNIPSKLANYKWDYGLEKTAMIRAKEIAVSYSHTRPDNSSCYTAYSEGGASTSSSQAENIAFSYSSVEDVMERWAE